VGADGGEHAATASVLCAARRGTRPGRQAVRANGLAVGPMAGSDSAGVDAEFFGDGGHHTILVVNIGHPGKDAWFGRLPRLAHDDVVQWAGDSGRRLVVLRCPDRVQRCRERLEIDRVEMIENPSPHALDMIGVGVG